MEFRTPSYFALATLVDGPLHGYAIVRRAAELSDGEVRLSTGTLYALLERAIDEGLVVAGEPYLEGGRQRRDYTLTQIGRARAPGRGRAARARRAHGHAAAARDRHGGGAMSGERIAELALLAYPAARRAARGEEMLATLLDASAGSRRRFAREIADLVRLGLRARGSQTASAGARRIVADGLCLAAVWLMTLDVSTLLSQRARGMRDPLLSSPSIALLAAVLAWRWSAMTGSPAPARWCGRRCAFRRCGTTTPGSSTSRPRSSPSSASACWCSLPADGLPTPGVWRGCWCRPPWSRRPGRRRGEASPLLLAGVLLAALLVVVGGRRAAPDGSAPGHRGRGLTEQPRDRRRGINHDSALVPWLFVAAAPLVLAAAITRTRRLLGHAPI